MSQHKLTFQTTKLPGYQPKSFPEQQPDKDLEFHKQLLTEIIFSLWRRKKQENAQRGWPPQPVHQKEIFDEYKAKIRRYKDMDALHHLHGKDRFWPSYARVHDHNWIERRVNYLATPAWGPKKDGVLMIVNVTAGKYAPNNLLFKNTKGGHQ